MSSPPEFYSLHESRLAKSKSISCVKSLQPEASASTEGRLEDILEEAKRNRPRKASLDYGNTDTQDQVSQKLRTGDVVSLERKNKVGKKLIVFMVGLPARGKSFISKKLRRYLSWRGYNARVFNVGNARRKVANPGEAHDSKFFDPENSNAKLLREQLAMEVLDELVDWLKIGGGKIAIHDATNSTRARRLKLLERVKNEPDIEVIFLENICNDRTLLEQNVNMKLYSPDYVGKDPEIARQDFLNRLANYEKAYETIEEDEAPNLHYIKLIDVGRKVVIYNIEGYLGSQIVFFLMNIHLIQRPIYILRHGESEFNRQGRIGGDSSLSARGLLFARAFANFISHQSELKAKDVHVYTSSLKRAIETAQFLPPHYQYSRHPMLDELFAGPCEGMTYEEILEKMPEEFYSRMKDKLHYRYPQGGESYMDLLERVRPVIIDVEREQSPIIIVSHLAVLRIIYGYFMDIPLRDVPYIHIPLHSVICLTQKPGGMEQKMFNLDEGVKEPVWMFNATVVETVHRVKGMLSVEPSDEQVASPGPDTPTTKKKSSMTAEAASSSSNPPSKFICQWAGCNGSFTSADTLMYHVNAEHLPNPGRRKRTTSEGPL
eukprot:Colp12_sorted_trinity150504_noHs@15572